MAQTKEESTWIADIWQESFIPATSFVSALFKNLLDPKDRMFIAGQFRIG